MTGAFSAIDTVIFDFDGTLVDSVGIKRRAYFTAAAAHGIPSDSVERAMQLQPGADRFGVTAEIARQAGGPDRLGEEMAAEYTRICENMIADCPEIPGAGACIAALRESGLHLFIVSATPQDPLTALVARRGMENFFDGVFGLPPSKPENLRRAMKVTGTAPERTLVVGDDVNDSEAAHQVGARFVLVDRNGAGMAELACTPWAVVTTLEELTGLID